MESIKPTTAACAATAYVDQSADELGFLVVRGHIDPHRWGVFASRDLEIGDFRVGLHVIGASHVIHVAHGDRVWSEMLACRDADQGSTILHHDRGGAWPARLQASKGGIAWRTRLERQHRPDLVNPDDLLPPDEAGSVAHVFPGTDRGPAPITRVSAVRGADQRSVILRSLHWYEADAIAVTSESHVTLTEGNS